MTPVILGIEQTEILRLLLRKGANPDLGRRFDQTALIYAVDGGLDETVELLLEHNASVDMEYDGDSQYWSGWTPMRFAVTTRVGIDGMVRRLAEAGANLKHKANGIPLIRSAATGDYLQEFLEFSGRIDIDEGDDEEGIAAIHCVDTTLNNLRRLLNAGANIEAVTTRSRDTPLSMAVTAIDGLARAKLLLERGASINRGSPWNGSPLCQACWKGEWETVKFLVEQGANVNQPCDGLNGTPLQAIILRNQGANDPSPEEMVRYLLDEEEHPHVRPRESRADVTAQGGLLGFPIIAAAFSATPNVINLILEQKGATVDVRDKMGRMPIHLAALNGMSNFEVILENSGDINAKDKMGRTALHFAAQSGHKQVVEKIISLLSDKTAIDAPDIDGWTPLCWAARRPSSWRDEEYASESPQQKEVITLLLENGADRTVLANVGDEKWTPLEIGRFSACSRESMALLAHGPMSNGVSDPEKSDDMEEPHKVKSQRGYYQNYCCDACEWVSYYAVLPTLTFTNAMR
jgi:ankyrin repeat protein